MNEDIKLIKKILTETEGMDDATYKRLCKTLDHLIGFYKDDDVGYTNER